jgi:hypothetical protein
MPLLVSKILAALVVAAQAEAPPAAPAGDALINRFIAVIPDPGSEPDPTELEHLTTLNPGRSGEIVPILQRFSRCRNAYGITALRRVAAGLGEAQLTRLIAFYEGDDFRIFERLAARPEEALSEQERAERDRILAAYPLAEFMTAMQPSNPVFSVEDALAMVERCERERDRTLDQRGLRGSSD